MQKSVTSVEEALMIFNLYSGINIHFGIYETRKLLEVFKYQMTVTLSLTSAYFLGFGFMKQNLLFTQGLHKVHCSFSGTKEAA